MKSRWSRWQASASTSTTCPPWSAQGQRLPFDVAEDDPLLLYLQQHPGTVAVQDLELESPALDAMRAAGIEVVVPLVSQGELIGVLNLGPRRSERPYNLDDRRLLDNLAGKRGGGHPGPHLVRHRAQQAQQRERIDNELKVAQLIQKQFLPQRHRHPRGGPSRPTTARLARWAVTSTTSSRCRRVASGWWSATSPTRACRPRW